MKFVILLLLLLDAKLLFCQLLFSDVRSMAMGNATIASLPLNSIPENIALIPEENETRIACTVANNFSIKDLSPVYLSFLKSFSSKTAIVSTIGKMGNSSFSEQFIETGISKKIASKFAVGIKIQFHQWIVNDSYYSNSHAFIPTILLFANPLKNLCFGVLIRNPVRVRMNAIEQERLPAMIHAGASIKVSEKIVVVTSLLQQTYLPVSVQFGTEYIFHPKLFIRFGWQTEPVSETLGFALKLSKFNIDMSFKTHQTLGNSSALAITFPL